MVFIRIHGICCCPHDVGCDGAGTTSPGETMKRERVVLREGAVGLSIDDVAKEAGVSKATVMYDHKSKQDLLSDLISRLMPVEEERVQQAIAESNNTPHPALYGRIISASNALSHTERAVVLAVSESLTNDTNIRDTMRSCTNKDLDEIKEDQNQTLPSWYIWRYLVSTAKNFLIFTNDLLASEIKLSKAFAVCMNHTLTSLNK